MLDKALGGLPYVGSVEDKRSEISCMIDYVHVSNYCISFGICIMPSYAAILCHLSLSLPHTLISPASDL